ncbi:M6 family metalloprotease domain-containing protein [Geofilum sp. OHC36d9]|uniref:M6 family metalloprotease domain-containing protein n=1 Tax=Geofilum sp. OHC36d9 TaxID=3458413 RepID=UPI004033E6D0
MKFKTCFTTLLKLVFIGFLFSATTSIRAVGGYPFPQKIIQPDGSSLTIQMHGDEWFNWVATTDGYRIVRNQNGLFEYATFLKSGKAVPSGVKASDPDLRNNAERDFLTDMSRGAGVSRDVIAAKRAAKNSLLLKSSGDHLFEPSGTQKMLVILANFSDTQPYHEQSVFDAMMNEAGYNGTGSFADYYDEVSGGLLTMVSQVTAWVTVPNNHDYYGSEDKWSEFAYEAVKAAANLNIDFSQFDNDGDGVVEGIAIIHQGPGQEVTGDETDIWSHSYSFSSAGYSRLARSFDGVMLDQYTIQPETRNSSGDQNTIGVICHEFGHNLGLPDYYDTIDDDVTYAGTGRWDLMNQGNYNGTPAGSRPAHHNAFSKIELGWMTEEVISTAGHLSLASSISSGVAYRVNSPELNDYFLMENRQKTGFDAALPGHGMVVYHVDTDVITAKRNSNEINTDEHQGLYVVAAAGYVNASSAPFPGANDVTQLTDDSDPAMITWTGLPYNRSITGIQENGGVVSFDFLALQNGSPLALGATNISSSENEIYWTPSGEDTPVLLAWSDDGVFGVPEDGVVYTVGDEISGGGTILYYGSADTLFSHSGLSASSLYYYSVWSNLGTSWSGALTTQKLTPAETVSVFPWVQDFESDLLDWQQESLLGDYLWERRDTGLGNTPAAAAKGSWFSSFFVESYTTGSTRLISPPLQLEAGKVYDLDFYHIQAPWDEDQDYLEVYVKKEGSETWESLANEDEAEKEWIHKRYRLPYSQALQVAFVGIGNYGYGVGLDDVVISEGAACETSLLGAASVHSPGNTETTIQLAWSLPTDESVLIVARKGNKTLELPKVGVGYDANAEFGTGAALGDDEYVVYAGNGTEVIVTGLENSSDYYFSFFAYADGYCYQMAPDRYIFPTESVFYSMTMEVTNGTAPIDNATAFIDGTPYVVDASGTISWMAEHNENYKAIKIEADGYKTRWTRFKAIKDSTISVTMQSIDNLVPVRNISHQKQDNVVTLNWDPVIDEGFEGYDAFALEMQGWTQIDKDESPTYGLSDLSFPNEKYTGSFIVLNPFYDGLLQSEYDMMPFNGKYCLAAFSSFNAYNNDWLISPAVTVESGDEVSFMARSLTDSYGLETFKVFVSVQESSDDEFVLISDGSEVVPLDWTRYAYSLDAYAGKKVKIAINYNSEDHLALLLDDLRMGPVAQNVEGAPGLRSSKVLKSNVDKIKRSRVVKVQKQSSLLSEDLTVYSGLGYSVMINDTDAGSSIGFSNSTISMSSATCGSNVFKVRTDYLDFNTSSLWSEDYDVTGCYTVTFVVTNEDKELLEGATVVFDGQTVTTNVQGLAVFDGVDLVSGVAYSVSLDGFATQAGSVSIDADKEMAVELKIVVTDTTQLAIDDEVLVFPNPLINDQMLQIQGVIAGDFRINVYNAQGQLLLNEKRQGGAIVTIDLPATADGIFVVELIRDDDVRRFKVVKR